MYNNTDISADHPSYYINECRLILQNQESLLWGVIDLREESFFSSHFELSAIQEAFSFRHLYRARKISHFLIDKEGKLDQKKLGQIIEKISNEFPPPYPNGANDDEVRAGMLRTLQTIQKNKHLTTLFDKFKFPVANHLVEQLIRFSLQLSKEEKLGERHLKEAVLSALLFPLRQTVGSCFATAPAIIIQQEQVERLLLDLYDLMMVSRLKRTFLGVENIAPLSLSTGVGDLKKPVKFRDPFLSLSPGLLGAFEEIGLIEKTLSFSKKTEKLQKLFTSYLPNGGNGNIEECIHLITQSSGLPKEKEKLACETFKAYTDHPLLKAWEFTLASFADYKIEFFKWNLFASLGLNHEEEGGIGQLLYHYLQTKLDEKNEEATSLFQEYQRAFDELKVSEVLLRQADSRERARQLKIEVEMRGYHLRSCQEMYEKAQEIAKNLSSFYSFLINQYMQKFQEYFQEIYDAEMFDITSGLYDDSPAGFRLVYKHGRQDPTLWTPIHDAKSYQEALSLFFLATEPMITATCEWVEGKEIIEEGTTALIHHVKTDYFLETAFRRMSLAHQTKLLHNPLENIEKAEKKPWSYTSGGNMNTLLRCYYCLDQEITEEKRVIDSETDFLLFLLDLMKALPYSVTKPFEEQEHIGLLMNSPTHAFVFRPGLSLLREGWVDKGFTYTWVRDRILLPAQEFYKNILISREEQMFLARHFSDYHPSISVDSFFPESTPITLPEFRKNFFEALAPHFSPQILIAHIDSFLRKVFPLFSLTEARAYAHKIFSEFYRNKESSLKEKALEKFVSSLPSSPFFSFCSYYYLLVATIFTMETFPLAYSIYAKLDACLKKLKLSPPPPLLFADTNWAQYYFGFVVNPSTLGLELWRLDRRGQNGMPMSSWKEYVDGTSKKPWGILTNPKEYHGNYLHDFTLLTKKV